MCNYIILFEKLHNYLNNSIIHEILLDQENNIYIGIINPNTNPYSSQFIQIGNNGYLYRLEKFIKTPNSLIFKYEYNTLMIIYKRNNNIYINIEEPINKKSITKQIDFFVKSIFTPIKFNDLSIEYDEIYDFIKPKYENIHTHMEKELYFKYISVNQEIMER